jgi:hypothetical protein
VHCSVLGWLPSVIESVEYGKGVGIRRILYNLQSARGNPADGILAGFGWVVMIQPNDCRE